MSKTETKKRKRKASYLHTLTKPSYHRNTVLHKVFHSEKPESCPTALPLGTPGGGGGEGGAIVERGNEAAGRGVGAGRTTCPAEAEVKVASSTVTFLRWLGVPEK